MVNYANSILLKMNNTCYCVALLFIGHIWCFTSRNTL
ncbi:hypothetical protein T01_8423 [Trichinella spiralis]|uniref:Uncharacterized protein n=1 Tax=Trichinella spiralis TaxID=6334 RepID=A0A0V1AKX1_TRISP|nr:hypothetical protein T01_8423 [Trichinella spiralis]